MPQSSLSEPSLMSLWSLRSFVILSYKYNFTPRKYVRGSAGP